MSAFAADADGSLNEAEMDGVDDSVPDEVAAMFDLKQKKKKKKKKVFCVKIYLK